MADREAVHGPSHGFSLFRNGFSLFRNGFSLSGFLLLR
jgi:hypothetical protein